MHHSTSHRSQVAMSPRRPRWRRSAIAAIATGSVVLPLTAGTAWANIDKTTLTPSGSITVTTPGTVIDAMYVRGAINVKADNVTVSNSVVEYGGYHSIRIYDGVVGTRILDTEVFCLDPSRTNGVVFGNYIADGVDLAGCRNDFVFSDQRPATITNSTIDGVAYTNVAPAPEPEPTTEPQAEPRFPDQGTTGVPADVVLKPTGSLTITRDGTVLDGMHVTGTVTIAANDVVVRNTLVETGTSLYPIAVRSGTKGALIENVEVDNKGGTGIGVFLNGSAVVRNANIHSAEDGIRIQSNDVTVENSYIHDMQRQVGGHHDSIQIRSGDNITIRGNNLQSYKASTDDPMNAAIQIGSLSGTNLISNLLVVGNLMNGGNYTVNAGRGIVDSARYADNQFGRDYRYGVVGNIDGASLWEDTNVWYDNGEPVR